MKSFIRAALLAAILLAASSASRAQVSIGISIGAPPPPRVVYVQPAEPGPEYVWIEGYWYPVGRHYRWHDGYWTRPPYLGARWVSPYYDRGQFFVGYWEGEHGRFEHDHHWDRDKDRDFDRDRDHDRGRGHNRGRRGHDRDGDHDDH